MSRLFTKSILPTTILARSSVTASTQRLVSTTAARRTTLAAPFFARTPPTQVPARGFRSTPANMTVHEVKSSEEFKAALANNKVVLVDFFAVWCGPCKAISPKVEQWSEQYPNIHYVKVDVDELPEVSQEYSIRAMPTFLLFKDGEKAEELVGAIPPKLEAVIVAHHPA
ncbi:hypothetical protein RB595_006378 [Gaeumannomyces hyphopodioides]